MKLILFCLALLLPLLLAVVVAIVVVVVIVVAVVVAAAFVCQPTNKKSRHTHTHIHRNGLPFLLLDLKFHVCKRRVAVVL